MATTMTWPQASLGWVPSASSRSPVQASPSSRPRVGGTISAPGLARGRCGSEATLSLQCLVAVAWGAKLQRRSRSLVRRAAWRRHASGKPVKERQPKWSNEEEFNKVQQWMELPPKPARIRKAKGNMPYSPDAPTDEELEFMVEEMVPSPRRQNRNGQFDHRRDDPLTKGIEVMTMHKNQVHRLICCKGCGIPLQTHDPQNVGYVELYTYAEAYKAKSHRKLLCTRCLDLERGDLRPVVKETLGPPAAAQTDRPGFGDHVVPAAALKQQLLAIRKRRCLVVYVLDILDFNGSFIRNLREIVGRNPVIVVATKIDLLPPKTDLDEVTNWLRYALFKKKLRALDIIPVSNVSKKNISVAMNAIMEARRSMDVFVVGAANAGKSMFITKFLNRLEIKFPSGKVEEVERPMVSRTPGTTLGTIPLRAFRRSKDSPVFSNLYDTPGVHQPTSLQNLLNIEEYSKVQPTRKFGVHNVRPASDVLAELRRSGELMNVANTQAWLSRPVRYMWGFADNDPVVGVELVPPISPMVQLSFVAVANLGVTCESIKDVEGKTTPRPPDGLALANICYIKMPEELTEEGQVIADVALAGFGWVAVTASPVSAAAAGRKMERTTVCLRVYGPARLTVKIGAYPMPVYGLPGSVKRPTEKEAEEVYDAGFEVMQDVVDDADTLDNAEETEELAEVGVAGEASESPQEASPVPWSDLPRLEAARYSTRRRRPMNAAPSRTEGDDDLGDEEEELLLESLRKDADNDDFLDDILPEDDLPEDMQGFDPLDGLSEEAEEEEDEEDFSELPMELTSRASSTALERAYGRRDSRDQPRKQDHKVRQNSSNMPRNNRKTGKGNGKGQSRSFLQHEESSEEANYVRHGPGQPRPEYPREVRHMGGSGGAAGGLVRRIRR